jgi:hypothetical protein
MKLLHTAVATLLASTAVVTAGPAAQAASAPMSCVANLSTGAYTCADDIAARAAVGTTALAQLWTDPNYTGATLLIVNDGPCDTDRTTMEHLDPSFDDPKWNNAFESVKTYGNCRIKLFRWTNYNGGSTSWINEWADFNTGDNWADNVSSLKVS